MHSPPPEARVGCLPACSMSVVTLAPALAIAVSRVAASGGGLTLALQMSGRHPAYRGQSVVVSVMMQTGGSARTVGIGLTDTGWPDAGVSGSPLAAPTWPGMKPTIGAYASVPAIDPTGGAATRQLHPQALTPVGTPGIWVILAAPAAQPQRPRTYRVSSGHAVLIAGTTAPALAGTEIQLAKEVLQGVAAGEPHYTDRDDPDRCARTFPDALAPRHTRNVRDPGQAAARPSAIPPRPRLRPHNDSPLSGDPRAPCSVHAPPLHVTESCVVSIQASTRCRRSATAG
jgi:hypothetical protein